MTIDPRDFEDAPVRDLSRRKQDSAFSEIRYELKKSDVSVVKYTESTTYHGCRRTVSINLETGEKEVTVHL